jgi:hypothetical protein
MTDLSGYLPESLREGRTLPFIPAGGTAVHRLSSQWHLPRNSRRRTVSGGSSTNTRRSGPPSNLMTSGQIHRAESYPRDPRRGLTLPKV